MTHPNPRPQPRSQPRPQPRLPVTGPDGSCCTDANTSDGNAHDEACLRRQQAWRVQRDGYCIDPALPWTAWRFWPLINQYAAWYCGASFEDCMETITWYRNNHEQHTKEKDPA